MSKVWLIIKREFVFRVGKKSFLIMTLLGPLFFALLLVIPAYLTLQSVEDNRVIMVMDEKGFFPDSAYNSEYFVFQSLSSAKGFSEGFIKYTTSTASTFLYIPTAGNPVLYTKSPLNAAFTEWLKLKISRQFLLNDFSADPGNKKIIQNLENQPELKVTPLFQEVPVNPALTGFSTISGILIYLFILGYTMQVMRGVIEEKNGRIAELIITSVKPGSLMLGKILGIALVSLTQFLIWIMLATGITYLLSARFGESINLFKSENINRTIQSEGIDIQQAIEWNAIIEAFQDVNLVSFGLVFIFFFVFGYLFYSAIFAAIGAVVDSETETQQFVFPLTLPILLCFALMTKFINEPESTTTLFFSLLPFTSPVVTMFMLPYGISKINLILSGVFLTCSFLFTTWVAGKVFRTGILMYGKKAGISEIWKWIRAS